MNSKVTTEERNRHLADALVGKSNYLADVERYWQEEGGKVYQPVFGIGSQEVSEAPIIWKSLGISKTGSAMRESDRMWLRDTNEWEENGGDDDDSDGIEWDEDELKEREAAKAARELERTYEREEVKVYMNVEVDRSMSGTARKKVALFVNQKSYGTTSDSTYQHVSIDMSKRPAVDALEDIAGYDSPMSKKSRNGDAPTNGFYTINGTPAHAKVEDEDEADEVTPSVGHEHVAEAADDGPVHSEEQGEEEGEGEEQEEDESYAPVRRRQEGPAEGYDDLYLDTIDRQVLDFDFEKLCSVSLSNINVYACLICGKYFQGRGPKSHAYFHALELGHHVYINMQTQKVYVLPEGYEVKNKSLDDIKFVSDPRYTKQEVMALDRMHTKSWALNGKEYNPGFVGMNNIKENDYFNAIIQSLSHIPPLRNYFLLEDFNSAPELSKRVSILMRKIWNPRAFKTHISPHELLQEISQKSTKKFTLTTQSDPVEFLSWFLNTLHLALGGSKTKSPSSIIQSIFQGRLKIESQQITAKADAQDRLRFEDSSEVQTQIQKFMMLTLDLPAAPLFQDELEKNIIPQVPLTKLLAKYNGITPLEMVGLRKRFRLLHPLPPYLTFHIKRFSSNKFVSERNPTIVTFDARNLDIGPYVQPDPTQHPPGEPIWYDLVANVVHEAVSAREVEGEEKKVWKVQLRDKGRESWVQIQDLFLESVQRELLYLGESYLQIWERRREPVKRGARKN